MRGVGGPLLCIGDLLCDVGEPDSEDHHDRIPLSPSSSSSRNPNFNPDSQPSDLTKLFQENYDELNKALAGTDHSWTSLTLKLCNALDAANELIKSTNRNVVMLSEKVGELERVIRRGDSAIAAARSFHSSMIQKGDCSNGSQFLNQVGPHQPQE
ncbi:hypothetical protein Nepgr_002107 [Nepenthes gracilis]|uniref:Uncharacterized protein n=1 Tax=Nepenthes gracilis TaxID=150966 RepID=A0AAD3P6C8_NEPGR|nr:hypothetical protein Nepgr_002107 [Nepenthes gracilis]